MFPYAGPVCNLKLTEYPPYSERAETMKPPNQTAQTLAVQQQNSLSQTRTPCSTNQYPCRWDTLDKTLNLLIEQEESLLGDALTQCNLLLEESNLQVEEIKEFLQDEDEPK